MSILSKGRIERHLALSLSGLFLIVVLLAAAALFQSGEIARIAKSPQSGPADAAALASAAGVIGIAAWSALVLGAGLAGLFAVRAVAAIGRPLRALTAALERTAAGERSPVPLPGEAGSDLGRMAAAIDAIHRTLSGRQDPGGRPQTGEEAYRERAAQIGRLAAKFDEEALEMVQSVASASIDLQSMATSLRSQATQAEKQSDLVTALTEQASANTRTVASAADELSVSITEISRQVAQSSRIWQSAATDALRAAAEAGDLAETAEKIGTVVDLIKMIAAQTNLLALNAAIEAARAGEEGRGFAVVANEVKALAMQTVAATADISGQISAVQNQTAKVVASIQGISRVIDEVDHIATSIASAVEEQSSATQEIARNVEQVASSTSTVRDNVANIRVAAELTGKSSDAVLDAAKGLSVQANQLRGTTRSFLDKVLVADTAVASRDADPNALVFVAGDIPPYALVKDGKPDGAAVLIVAELAKSLGLPFDVEFQPWQRAQQTTQSNDNVGIIPLSRTPEREPLYKWVGPIVADQEVLLTRTGGKGAPRTLEEAKDWRVCVLRGSAGETALAAAGFTNLQAINDPASCARLLDSGRVDAWSAAKLVAPYQYRLNGLDPRLLQAGAVVRPNEIYLGLSRNISDERVGQWQKALDRLASSGTMAAIIKQFS